MSIFSSVAEFGYVRSESQYRAIPQLPTVIRCNDEVGTVKLKSHFAKKEGSTVLVDEKRIWPKCSLKSGVGLDIDFISDFRCLDLISEMEKAPNTHTDDILSRLIAAQKALNQAFDKTDGYRQPFRTALSAVWDEIFEML